MFARTILAILSGCLLLLGCNPSTKREEADRLSISRGALVSTSLGTCDTVANQGVAVTVNLWQPSDSSRAARTIREILTQKSIRRINSYADSASIAANPIASKSIKGAFEVFEKNYIDFRKTVPDASGCWQIELKGDTVMVTPKVLFYQLNHYAFTGGAHPNNFLSYHAFEAKTGVEMEMKSFIADSVALLNLIEKKFRQIEKLPADVDLEKAGYFLVNHKFFRPANYVFTSEGALFYYNPYEIAPYVRGPIEFTIPYNELGSIVRRGEIF